MDIIQALKTGKPVRRPISKHIGSNRSGYLSNEFVLGLLLNEGTASMFKNTPQVAQLINKADLFASDWEVYEKT